MWAGDKEPQALCLLWFKGSYGTRMFCHVFKMRKEDLGWAHALMEDNNPVGKGTAGPRAPALVRLPIVAMTHHSQRQLEEERVCLALISFLNYHPLRIKSR